MSRVSITVLSSVLLFAACVAAWGSPAILDKYRPRTGWVSNFPSTATVTVSAGGSFSAAQSACNSRVGANGFCTIRLNGSPSERTISVTRSRTRVTAADGVEIRSSGSVTFVEISTSGLRFILIDGLTLKGHTAANVFGVFVSGSNIRKVVIRNCDISGFNAGSNAHGIAVYGEGSRATAEVLIEGNEVYNMKTGSSESIVVNGNVVRWAIQNNYVHDVNNIAIDAIGGEGTLAPVGSGRVVPSQKDVARFGFIESNRVSRMSTRTNPAYGNRRSWAAGIYVDGGRNIRIDGNDVEDTPWGIDIGAENCVITRNVVVTNNRVTGSYYGDFLAGGYARRGFLDFNSIECNPKSSQDQDEGHGYVKRITVKDNLFSSSNTNEDPVLVQFRTTFAIISDSRVSPINAGGNGSARGDANAIRNA